MCIGSPHYLITSFMDLSQIKCCLVLVVCISLVAPLSASTFISDGISGSSVSSVRRLLQVKKHCPESFEFQNYTNIIEKCKGPNYPPKLCCPALKEFACPFAESLNDPTNDCSAIMFSYINLRGRYPPGLFANECKEGLLGLECPALPPGSSQTGQESAGYKKNIRGSSNLMVLVALSLLSMQFM